MGVRTRRVNSNLTLGKCIDMSVITEYSRFNVLTPEAGDSSNSGHCNFLALLPLSKLFLAR